MIVTLQYVQKLRKLVIGASVSMQFFTYIIVTCFLYILDTVI